LGVGIIVIERPLDAELHDLNLAKKPKVGIVKAAAADNNREQPTKNIGVERRRGGAAAAATARTGFIFSCGACHVGGGGGKQTAAVCVRRRSDGHLAYRKVSLPITTPLRATAHPTDGVSVHLSTFASILRPGEKTPVQSCILRVAWRMIA